MILDIKDYRMKFPRTNDYLLDSKYDEKIWVSNPGMAVLNWKLNEDCPVYVTSVINGKAGERYKVMMVNPDDTIVLQHDGPIKQLTGSKMMIWLLRWLDDMAEYLNIVMQELNYAGDLYILVLFQLGSRRFYRASIMTRPV